MIRAANRSYLEFRFVLHAAFHLHRFGKLIVKLREGNPPHYGYTHQDAAYDRYLPMDKGDYRAMAYLVGSERKDNQRQQERRALIVRDKLIRAGLIKLTKSGRSFKPGHNWPGYVPPNKKLQ